MKIAVEGCAHGELEKIYDTIEEIEKHQQFKVDLLICCGDFQSTRNMGDIRTMAVPQKYQNMCSFYKYYSGEKTAPILTIFIGGNHEASNHLQELPYGGWVAPNIYYMGYAGVININGIRIGGISGIYKGQDYLKGRFEFSPYTDNTMRSVYHVRQFEVFRMKQLTGDLDIFISHDWPRGIYHYGDSNQLCKFKPYFKEEIDGNRLGSPPLEDLLKFLKPKYWFAAHLHCKFAALVTHDDEKQTKFLALDKCLPNRRFLQLLDVETEESDSLKLEYDLEWLTILNLTNHLLSVKQSPNFMPGPNGKERFEFTPSEEELEETKQKFKDGLKIPENFSAIVEPFNPDNSFDRSQEQPKAMINPQTTQFCEILGIDDPLVLAMSQSGVELNYSDSNLDVSGASEANTTFNNSLLSDGDFSSPLKRKSLTLPEPVAESSPTLEIEKDPNPDVVILEEIIHTPESKDSPPAPKFKRRNADIYQNTDE